MNALTRMHTHTHTHKHKLTNTHIHTQTCSHTHTHTPTLCVMCLFLCVFVCVWVCVCEQRHVSVCTWVCTHIYTQIPGCLWLHTAACGNTCARALCLNRGKRAHRSFLAMAMSPGAGFQKWQHVHHRPTGTLVTTHSNIMTVRLTWLSCVPGYSVSIIIWRLLLMLLP